MTHDQAAAILARITFLPGWTFEWYVAAPPDTASVLRVGTLERDVEDPAHPEVKVTLTDAIQRDALGLYDERMFLAWVRGVVEKRWLHEMNEWLRYRGQPIVEPHPEKFSRGILA